MNTENPIPVPIPQQATRKKTWQLTLFSEPTTQENYPVKLSEAFAIGFDVVHIFLLVLVTLAAVPVMFVALMFAVVGYPLGILITALAGVLLVTTIFLFFTWR